MDNTAKYALLKMGERIYYTGDMANPSDFGTIAEIIRPERWGMSYHLNLDDGRSFTIGPEMFHPGPGRRFWPLDEWEADRRRRIAETSGAIGDALRLIETRRNGEMG